MARPPRFLVISFPAHGHVNPALRLADRLALLGCDVTFVTTVFAHRTIVAPAATKTPSAVSFSTFSDGYKRRRGGSTDFNRYNVEFRSRGSNALREIVGTGREEGRPYGCLVYTLLQPWVADVAAEFDIPAALLWVQSATGFDIFYYYFHGFGDIIRESSTNRDSKSLNFPGLDQLGDLTVDDLPTSLDHSNPKSFLVSFFQEQFDAIDKESQPKVLVNTFDALELESLRAAASFNGLRLFGIGPLARSDHSSTDNIRSNDSVNITEWLDSKPKGSVVYVSFGSVAVLPRPQVEEIAKGLLELGRPFLWVIRKTDQEEEKDGIKLSCEEELRELGMIVPWCSQVEVLRHRALGCFVSHCGWNSSLESLACGVPVVAFPQAYDQMTNAKLIEDVWKIGLRVKALLISTSSSDEELGNGSVVGGDEIKGCLELVLLEGEEFKRNAEKWKDLAREAIMEGGSSDENLKAFVAEVIGEKAVCNNL